MIVDLTTQQQESGTFDLKEGGKVTLRLLSEKDMKELTEACVKKTPEYPYLPIMKDGKPTGECQYFRFERTEFNQELWNEMSWDRIIVGWEGVATADGQSIETTKENKIALMKKKQSFREDVDAGISALKEQSKTRQEEREKNS